MGEDSQFTGSLPLRLPTNCAVFVPLSPDLRVSRTCTPVMAGLFVIQTLTPRLTTASSWTWPPTKSRTASSSRLEIYVWLLEVLTQGGWAPWCLGRSILAPSILSKDSQGHVFATRLAYVFVIGKGNKPFISLPKGKGIKLSIAEERDKRLGVK